MSASIRRRLPIFILIAGLFLVIVALALKGWRIYQLGNSLQAHQLRAEGIVAAGPLNVDPDEAEMLVLDIRRDIVALQAEIGFVLPLAPRFSWLPRVGGLLEYAPELMEMADAGSAAAVFGVSALKPALELLQDEGAREPSPLPALVAIFAASQDELIQAGLAIDKVAAARAQIDCTEKLPWRVQQAFIQLDQYLPLAQSGLTAVQLIPELMGHDGRRSYLIMAQNEDELRPSGGFISGAGVLTVENGNILAIEFQDANVVDDFENKEYGPAPSPLLNFMGLYYWLFRDANWYSDFPSTAQWAMELYTRGRDVPLDGVIAVDKRFVGLLLSATGPVFVPELEAEISDDNVVDIMRAAWSIQEGEAVADWIVSRKDFMGPLALAVRSQVEQNPTSLDPLQFATIMDEALAGKHLQLYFRDPDAQAILAQLDWDAAVDNPAGADTLLLVEANLGYSKVNPAIERTLHYTVFLDKSGGGNARAGVEFRHTIPENGNGCAQLKPYSEGRAYEELLDDCYWVYFQLYTPAGSSLLQSSLHPVDASYLVTDLAWPGQALSQYDPIAELNIFANFMLLTRGQVVEPFFVYALPVGISRQDESGQWRYSLLVQKQAGISSLPIEIQVVLPEGMQPVTVPEGTSQDGNLLTLAKAIDRDELFVFIYQQVNTNE